LPKANAVTVPPWLWVALTLVAATAQTFRNAAQRSLIGPLGAVGATHVRFLFGLPFALAALAVVALVWAPLPAPNAVVLGWVGLGALSQIGATALMLAAMRERSFVVTTAYTKTEPVQVALFAVIFLGEQISASVAAAIVIATAGVLVMSWPARGGEVFSWRPALLGIVSGGLFAIAAVAFRGAIVAVGDADFIPAATLVLALTLAVQTVSLSLWLAVRNPATLRAIVAAWRPSLAAGFLGAFASEMWFLAFAIREPASVRTLGLVEILIAGLISRRLFAQTPGLRDIFGMVLVIGGVALLVAGI
jgi:drug/metabolite transporter (DMT)-like permease